MMNNMMSAQQNQEYCRHNFYALQDVLHNEILLFKQDANAILAEMQQVKIILIEKLTQKITNVSQTFNNYFVDVYGSHATGLCLHWSDIDLVVGPKPEYEHQEPQYHGQQDAKIKEALRRISDCLKQEIQNKWITSVMYVDTANVPVIKMKCSLEAVMRSAGIAFPKNPKYEEIYH